MPWSNATGIGLVPQEGTFFLDVDPRNGGDLSSLALEAMHGTLPPTVKSKTGGGGSHLHFRMRATGMKLWATVPASPGLDIKGSEGYRRAEQALQKAVELDPGYAVAWADLSWATFLAADLGSATQADAAPGYERARAAAEKAVAVGPEVAAAYRARCQIRSILDWQWEAASVDLQRASALKPGNPDVISENAVHLAFVGRAAEAVPLLRRAVSLDPLNAGVWGNLAVVLTATGDQEAAREAYSRANVLAPNGDLSGLGPCISFLLDGRADEALVAARRSTAPMYRLLGEAISQHSVGHAVESKRALDELIAKNGDNYSFLMAEVFAWRGERDHAFEWLARARAQRDTGLIWLEVAVLLRGLQDDPRWKKLLVSVNLPVE